MLYFKKIILYIGFIGFLAACGEEEQTHNQMSSEFMDLKTRKTSVTSQSDNPSSSAPSNGQWAVRCVDETKTQCEAYQKMTIEKSGARLIEMAVGFTRNAPENARGVFVLPLGIALRAPVTMKIDDGSAENISLYTCNSNGCIGNLTITPALQNKLRAGKNLTVDFLTTNKQRYNVVMSLTGIGKAMDLAKTGGVE